MRAHVQEIVFDCADPAALVRFWAGLLGGSPVDRSDDWSYVDPPDFVRIAFQRVPEGKAAKNRVHLDLEVEDPVRATAEAVAEGASPVGDLVTDAQGSFQVVRDPEGNEFCFVTG
ncbi:VOC family protein [Streptomyces sp. NPDC087908]|uniref:VOC family protein n=1 Tax=unclassified Streptomyces TaxID=2593676 RepID=UPI0011CE64A4|nr:VOC family protein [Streptomyces sp. adm13(2018)]TXS14889.1 VOC family protein [Streptomyces sp. adm13(2018)]